MMRLSLLAFTVLTLPLAARADSTVVFNEIMFHPATSETNNEWIELRNQMAVDMDISNWTLEEAVAFTFPEGTVVPGGGYVVVAIAPATLTGSGVTNVLGPFTGRLSNGGERLQLRNNNRRLMDSLTYGVEGDWPVGPDGAGPALAKFDENTASDQAGHWRASEVNGGTPGARNFPVRVTTVARTGVIAVASPWRYEAGGTDLGAAWRDPGYDDSLWSMGLGAFYAGTPPSAQTVPIPTLFHTGVGTNGASLAAGAADPHYLLVTSANGTPPPPGAATVTANHPNWLVNDSVSSWIGPVASGSANVAPGAYTFRTTFDLTGFNATTARVHLETAVDNDVTNILFNGVSLGLTYTGFTAYSSVFTVTNGFFTGANALEFRVWNGGAAANPSGFRARLNGTAQLPPPTNTALALGPNTYYFRQSFVVASNAALTGLQLRSLIDDGAVYYLNGVEVFRQNMPAGPVGFATPAGTNVGTANYTGPFNLTGVTLVDGTNVFAVEVHQATGGTADVLFAAELTLLTTNLPPAAPPALAFNEVSAVTNAQFTAEIINYGATPLAVGGFVLQRFGHTNSPAYTLPAQTLAPGDFLVLDRATLGFGADPDDQVVLWTPGQGTVLDAIIAKSYPRARLPDGTGDWLNPTAPSYGTSNLVTLHDEIVINEIMYSHRELPPTPAVNFTNPLLTMTNAWRYHQLGQDLGTEWRGTHYDDSLWPSGTALFWTGLSGTNLNTLRGTTLNLSNGAQPVITYYFRTPFVITNSPSRTLLNLRHYVDDGAVFYLNGEEIYRYGISAHPVYATNLATFNIGVPTNTGPVVLSTTNFIVGTNLLAVEVHQVFPPPASRDLVFGAELTATGVLTPALPARESPEAWVELFNRGSNAVNLTGWRLDRAINFSFPTGTMIAPGGYLVVAKDADYLRGLHPSLAVLGNFSGSLSQSGEAVILRDAADNRADRVRYYDAQPWPPFADGDGSTLELRDPRADNARPEAWADSDESRNSVWRTYTYSGTATVEPAASPTVWKEFIFGLLGAGEVWLDDFSVIENPLTTRKQLLQNGGFENGPAAWRFIGTHRRAEVITDPSNAANHILRLVARGDTEHMHNQASTTLTNGLGATNGLSYEISFRAKWIAGCHKLHTRLYFNRLARTTELVVPLTNGTPGVANSRSAANIGPTFEQLAHAPVVPAAAESVTVSVQAADPDGIASATLYYSVNGGAWQSTPIPVSGSPTIAPLAAVLPAQLPLAVVQFYIEATDTLGTTSTCPDGGTNSRALYAVGGQPLNARLKTMRLILPPADVAFLHSSTNVMSNDPYGCTVIADETTIFYNATLHLQGSERGRDNGTRVGFAVRLPAGQRYRGVHDRFTIDRSGGYSGRGGDHDEILIKHAANHAGGLPGMYDDLAQVFAPRSSDDGTGLLILAKYGPVFLDSQFENGGDGELYKLELIYHPTTTSTGDPQAPKLPQPDTVLGTDIKGLGEDPENYRWNFLKENHVARDDYAPMVALARAFDLTGQTLDAQTQLLMDVDEWMRAVAFINLLGGGDIYSMGNSHNLQIYFRPEDGRAMAFLWDMDFSFVNATSQAFPGTGSPNTTKLITTLPANHRAFLCHLYELTAVTGDSAYMNQWATRYSSLVGENWSAAATWMVQRAAYVRSQLPLATAFAISNNGGNGFATSNAQVTLTGTAPIPVKEIFVNGVPYPITWTSPTTWSILVPLPGPTNLLAVQGADRHGVILSNQNDTITITNTGLLAPVPVVINEWMAANGGPGGFPDPVDGAFQDWVELFNPNFVAVNLAGFHLTDNLSVPNKWQFPSNAVIAPRGFLLVWADNQTAQNGPGGTGDLHAGFQLNQDGEALGLYSTNLTPQHRITFGMQGQNVSQGLFPDGNTNAVYFMAHWTPHAANQVGTLAAPLCTNVALLPDGRLTFDITTTPDRLYRVDFKNALDDLAWSALATNRATGPVLNLADPATNGVQRFYRAVLIP